MEFGSGKACMIIACSVSDQISKEIHVLSCTITPNQHPDRTTPSTILAE